MSADGALSKKLVKEETKGPVNLPQIPRDPSIEANNAAI